MREGDRDGVVRGFQESGSETRLAISRMARERGEQKDVAKMRFECG